MGVNCGIRCGACPSGAAGKCGGVRPLEPTLREIGFGCRSRQNSRPSLAEDVVQEALILAYRGIETLRDDAKFGPWLMTIVRRQIVDAVRTRPLSVGGPLEERIQDDRADAAVDSWIDHQQLLSLIDRLPERERVLIGLRYFDGHSLAAIAAITAHPLGTATKQLSRAITRLRSWWDKEN